MKILLSNIPAYIKDPERHYNGAGSQRWSATYKIRKGDPGAAEWKYMEYPFNIGYSTALLKRDTDWTVKAWDPCVLDLDVNDFRSYVKSYSPDILLVEVPTVAFPLMLPILGDLKKEVGFKLAISGPHITGIPEDMMNEYKFIDFGLVGEYELTLRELVNNYSKFPSGFDEIHGLAFRQGDSVKINQRRMLIDPLDQLPFPDREDLPAQRYEDAVFADTPCIQMLSSRGCPVGCTFCVPIQTMFASSMYRRRSPKEIVDEMILVKEKYGARQVYFDDDTMVINKKHVQAVCQEIIDRKVDLPWSCMGDITIAEDALKMMADAGFCGIKFGVDSVTPQALKAVHKGTVTTDKVTAFVQKCKSLGIKTHASFVVGLPSDTREGVYNMVDYALHLGVDNAQFSIATPFPGTPFFEEAKAKGWLRTYDWTQYDGERTAVLNYPNLSSKEIEELRQYAVDTWFKHMVKTTIKNPKNMMLQIRRRGLKGSISGIKAVMKGKYVLNG